MLKPVGLDWITALRAPTIKSLLEQGAFQLSLFDERDLAEVGSPEFPDVSRRQGTTHRQAGVDRYSDRDMAAVAVVNVNAPMQEAQMRLEQLTWSERVVSPLDGLITSRKVDVEPSRRGRHGV